MPTDQQSRNQLNYIRHIVAPLVVGPLVDDDTIEFISREVLDERWRDGNHRRSASEGLARTGSAKVTAPRIEGALASERDKRVRLAMSFALASAGRPIAPVVDAVLDDDLAEQALEYLVEIGQAHAVDLAARLRDQNPLIRQHVAIALGFVGGPDSAAALTAAATDTNTDVRSAVEVAQLRLRGGKP